jgi:hypothetical protein
LLYSRTSQSIAIYRFSFSNDQLSMPIIAADPFRIDFPSQTDTNGAASQVRDLLIREARQSLDYDDDDDDDADNVCELFLLLENGSLWRSLLGPWDDCKWEYLNKQKNPVKAPQSSFLVSTGAGLAPLSAQVMRYPIPGFTQDPYALRERKLRDESYQRPGYDMLLVYSQFSSIRASICSGNPKLKDFAARDFATIYDDFQPVIASPDFMLDPSATL